MIRRSYVHKLNNSLRYTEKGTSYTARSQHTFVLFNLHGENQNRKYHVGEGFFGIVFLIRNEDKIYTPKDF